MPNYEKILKVAQQFSYWEFAHQNQSFSFLALFNNCVTDPLLKPQSDFITDQLITTILAALQGTSSHTGLTLSGETVINRSLLANAPYLILAAFVPSHFYVPDT